MVIGVKIGPSPDWLRSTLEKVGIRSINNVVDVTNFVMLEIGQPLHAFDYHLIARGQDGKPTIVVRHAAANEKFKTLDNTERNLNADMLLIADEQKGIALAGVMGGQNTEINDSTKDVLIEEARISIRPIFAKSALLGDARPAQRIQSTASSVARMWAFAIGPVSARHNSFWKPPAAKSPKAWWTCVSKAGYRRSKSRCGIIK